MKLCFAFLIPRSRILGLLSRPVLLGASWHPGLRILEERVDHFGGRPSTNSEAITVSPPRAGQALAPCFSAAEPWVEDRQRATLHGAAGCGGFDGWSYVSKGTGSGLASLHSCSQTRNPSQGRADCLIAPRAAPCTSRAPSGFREQFHCLLNR